jgi:hypothetical protein
MVPQSWVERLARARHIATYRVALHVLYRRWKMREQPFALTNEAMEEEGVSRWRKWDGLREPNDGETPYHAPETLDDRALHVLVNSDKVTADSLTTMLHRKLDWLGSLTTVPIPTG